MILKKPLTEEEEETRTKQSLDSPQTIEAFKKILYKEFYNTNRLQRKKCHIHT